MNLNMKFDWNDISIVPAILSDISSRNEVDTRNKDNKLPLFTAPMDMVISAENVDKFYNSGLNITLPRHIKYDELKNDNYFYSYGLDEIIEILDNKVQLPPKVLIDIANGNMRKLYDTSKRIKDLYGDNIELMIGNIANPETYRMFCDIGVDYCRVFLRFAMFSFATDTSTFIKEQIALPGRFALKNNINYSEPHSQNRPPDFPFAHVVTSPYFARRIFLHMQASDEEYAVKFGSE
jgi:hypothetical protein